MEFQNSNYTSRNRVKLNVGGKLFETTVQTLQSSGPDSLLSVLSNRSTPDPVFIDRDPEIFSILLSLLRTNHLPSAAAKFSKQELSDEASYYGLESRLRSALSPPFFSGIDAALISTLRPTSDGVATTFSAGNDGSVWMAHGGQISSYDWNLTHTSTIRTHLENIGALRRVWPEVAAVGSECSAGLHFYDFNNSSHVGSVHWTDPSDPRIYKANVTAITDSKEKVFAAFECPHRENCILSIDKSTIQIESEIGRQSGSSAKNIVPCKLRWIGERNVVFGAAVSSGAFGYSGYIRIWDPRNGEVVWEMNEPGSGRSSRFGDSFADVDVDVEEGLMFKICSKSGDFAMADLRKLSEDPWVYIQDKNPSMRFIGGGVSSCVLSCYESQVFVGREGGLEVWSRVCGKGEEDEEEGLYRRNFVDRVKDAERGVIKKIEGGGNRLFVGRENVEGIEIWESSIFSGLGSVS